jgi:hypothetical protein
MHFFLAPGRELWWVEKVSCLFAPGRQHWCGMPANQVQVCITTTVKKGSDF